MNPLLWIGFNGQDPQDVPSDLAPGGIIPFSRNLDSDPERGPARLKALLDGLQARWGTELPLAVALDQEGGAVSRLKPWVGETPSFRALWEQGGAAACEAWGRLWGEGLGLLGFNVDFAPVADLWDGFAGTGLGNRCASREPAEVARAACVSPFHFHRGFTQAFQTTPHAYITELRLDHARQLLEAGWPVLDASINVGFSSPSTFSRLFRSRFGDAPSAIRKHRNFARSKK